MGDGASGAPPASGRKLSPLEAFTTNFRNKQLHSSFDGIPTEEGVKQNFICSLKGEGLAKQKGRLYLTQNYLAFTSSLFGKTTKHLFKWEDIVSIEADIGEIIVSTQDQELPFSSFINFEEAVEAINECWRGSLAGPSTNGIVFVHHPAGNKPVTDSNTSDSDDDYTSSETSDSEGEVTFEDLLNTVNNAKESIGQEITEEKERQKEHKKNQKKKDSDDDSSSSSSSDDEEDKAKEEEELENLKKAALEERKALLQKLKKQKEDELEQKKLELAQKLKEKQEHNPTAPSSQQHEDKVKDEKTEEVWGEVEKTAEELEAKEAEERREEEERRRRREEQEQQEREAKAREVEEKLKREKEEKDRQEREEREREEKKREAVKTTPPSPTITTPPSTPTSITPTTKPVIVSSSSGSFLNSWWLLGASVAAAVVVGAVVYKMRSGK